MNEQKTELWNKIVEIAKDEENIHDFELGEDTDWISFHCLFELDEEDCLPAFKKLCAKIGEATGKKYTINEIFFEVLFYL